MQFVRLKELRQDSDMVQQEVAEVLGIDQRVYSTYETGKRDIPIQHLIILADYYGVSIDYIVGRTNERLLPANKTK